MNIVVTGCAGYIGSALVKKLLEETNHDVIGIDCFLFNNHAVMLPYLSNPRFVIEVGSVTNVEHSAFKTIIKTADVIIPLAALVGAPLCDSMPERAEIVNTRSIRAMMDMLSKDQRVIFPNTNSGYGQTDGQSFCTELSPMNPISVYGRTKCSAEKFVLNHQNSVSFRLATVFGVSPRMRLDLLVNDFVHRFSNYNFKAQNYIELYEPHFMRNFVSINDVVNAFIWAIDNPEIQGVFNLGNPSANLSKLQLANLIRDFYSLPESTIKVVEGKDQDQRNYIVSSDKIINAGFNFKYGLNEAIPELSEAMYLLKDADKSSMYNRLQDL